MTEPIDLEARRELREWRELDQEQERWEAARVALRRLQTPPISRPSASGP